MSNIQLGDFWRTTDGRRYRSKTLVCRSALLEELIRDACHRDKLYLAVSTPVTLKLARPAGIWPPRIAPMTELVYEGSTEPIFVIG